MTIMKVKDLLSQLSKLDPNLELYGYINDSCLIAKESPYHVLSIENIDVSIIESKRDGKGTPIFTFSEAEAKGARKVAFINLSADF